jgi:hypothetical protein
VEDREALMAHLLSSELTYVFFDEAEVGLVSLDRVTKVILHDLLLVVSEIRSQDSYARSTLKILSVIQFVENLLD